MIVQIKNDNTQYIYTPDASRDYLDVAKALGLVSGAGLASYVTTSPMEFTNANGAKVKAVRINGYSNLSYYVMNDSVKLDIKHRENLTKDMFKTILDGLNFFENARIKLGEKVYLAPFRALNYATMNTITDAAGNHIMLSSSQVRDVEAINVLLSRLDYDNGKMYEPLIRRYVNILAGLIDKSVLPIGYFNMENYLRIIQSQATTLFASFAKPKSKPTILLRSDGTPGYAKVVSAQGPYVNIQLSPNIQVLDLAKENAYNPYVIVSLKPFPIAQSSFPWKKVKYGNTAIFMSPIICNENKLRTLTKSINLLE